MRLTLLRLIICGIGICASALAWTQDFPSKPIRIVVPNSAGSGEDSVARLLCNELSATWKAGCVVENRPGGAGFISAQAVAQSPADGYTLLMGSAGIMAVNPHLYAKIPYDAIKDFIPVTMLGSYPYVMVTGPKFGAKSLEEFLQLSKKAGRATYAAYGPGSLTNIAPQMLKATSGAPLEFIAYKGIGIGIAPLSRTG